MRAGTVLFTAALALGASGTHGGDQPRLMLNPGGHSADVQGVAFTLDGKELISASNDHTICVWDVKTGELKRTVYLPVYSDTFGGRLAMSPDGRWLAKTWSDSRGAQVVLLMSLPDFRIVRQFVGNTDGIWDLTFSPTGKYLATGCKDGSVRLWEVSSGRPVRELRGHQNSVTGVCFSPDERHIATSAYDGGRIWLVETGKEIARLTDPLPNSTGMCGVAWSPDGKSIATGNLGNALRIWSTDGKVQSRHDALTTSRSLRFSKNSQAILSAGIRGGYLLDLQRKALRSSCVNLDSEFAWASVFSPDEQLVATGGRTGEELYLWNAATGQVVQHLAGPGKSPQGAAWSSDSQSIAWGTRLGGQFRYRPGDLHLRHPLERSFELSELQLNAEARGLWNPARSTSGKLTADFAFNPNGTTRGWVTVKEGGQELCTIEQNFSTVASFVPGDRIAVGGGLKLYDARTAKLLNSYVGCRSNVHAVSPSPDGRYMLASAGDMTLRIWPLEPAEVRTPRAAMGAESVRFLESVGLKQALDSPQGFQTIIDRLEQSEIDSQRRFAQKCREVYRTEIAAGRGEVEPLLNLFFAGDDWIAWTPEGYYAASPGGERLMGWHVNNGPDKLASFYPADRFRKQFYRPDVIKLLLTTGSVAAALQEAGSKQGPSDVAQNLPPLVEIVNSAQAAIDTEQQELKVIVSATQVGTHPVTSLQLLLNGRPLGGNAGIVKLDGRSTNPRHTFSVPLTAGAMYLIQARADSAVSYNLSSPLEVRATARPPAAGTPSAAAEPAPAALYVLAIGVADYTDAELDLNFADDDARRLAEVLQSNSSKLYRKVDVKLIVDKEATQRGILAGLGWLKTNMTQHDVGILFYSGHGGRDENANFYLLPSDIDREQPLLVSGVSDTQVKTILQGIPGRLVVMLDACHAGTLGGDRRKDDFALTDDLVRDLATDDFGIVTMASSMGRELSQELAAQQCGAFTLAIVEGLQGKADTNRDATIYFNELDAYVSERVKELTSGRQHPATAKPATIRSFPLSQFAAP